MTRDALLLARLSLLRLRRGRAVWVSGLLFLLPPLVTLVARAMGGLPWALARDTALHVSVLLAAPIHLAGAVGEELEQKTHTYLWSRPAPRAALLFGKLLAVVPLLAALSVLSLVVAYVAAGAPVPASELAFAALALVAGSVAASAFSVGIGTLFVKHPLVLAIAYLVAAENILWLLPPSVKNLSVLWHMTSLAGGTEPLFHLGALAVQSALWLGVGAFRVTTAEYASADV